jgi:hypothetical protein
MLKRSVIRLALCIVAFLFVWAGGIFSIGSVLYSSEVLFRGWVDWLRIFNALGLFEHSGSEEMQNAVIDSLVCIWLPLAAWVAWRLNRWLKRPE